MRLCSVDAAGRAVMVRDFPHPRSRCSRDLFLERRGVGAASSRARDLRSSRSNHIVTGGYKIAVARRSIPASKTPTASSSTRSGATGVNGTTGRIPIRA